MEKLKCKNPECESTKLQMSNHSGLTFICMDCNFISYFTFDEIGNKSFVINEIPASIRNIDVEADKLIKKINDVKNDIGSIGMQIKPDAKVIRSTTIVFELMEDIVNFVRRNHHG